MLSSLEHIIRVTRDTCYKEYHNTVHNNFKFRNFIWITHISISWATDCMHITDVEFV